MRQISSQTIILQTIQCETDIESDNHPTDNPMRDRYRVRQSSYTQNNHMRDSYRDRYISDRQTLKRQTDKQTTRDLVRYVTIAFPTETNLLVKQHRSLVSVPVPQVLRD